MRAPLALLALLATAAPTAARARARLEVAPGAVKPGDPLLVTVLGVASEPEGTVGDRALHFYEVPGGYQAVTGLSVDLRPGELVVRVEADEEQADGDAAAAVQLEANGEVVQPGESQGVVLEATVQVIDPQYPSRELTVAKKFISPPRSVKARIRADRKAFARALSQPFTPLQFSSDFAWPRRAELTAPFGDLRLFNGKKQSQHFGVDLDGNTGDPIEAANDGKVVMVRECYASGNTVIVHHGANLYTLYFHLSAFDVKQGDRVKKGQLLGKVGKTGRVTGPHLHWSVKVDGLYVDGVTLLELPFGKHLSPG